MARKKNKRRAYPWQRRRRLAIGVIVVTVVAIAALVVLRPSANHAIEEELAKLEQRGVPTNTEELKAWLRAREAGRRGRPAPHNETKPAGLLAKTFAPDAVDQDHYRLSKDKTLVKPVVEHANEPLTPDVRKQAERYLADNAGYLERLHEVAGRLAAGERMVMPKQREGYGVLHWMETVIQPLEIGAMMAAREGDAEEAGKYLLTLLRLNRLEHDAMPGAWYDCYLRFFFADRLCDLMPRVLWVAPLPDRHLKALADGLLATRNPDLLIEVVNSTRARLLETIHSAKETYFGGQLRVPGWLEPVYPSAGADAVSLLDTFGWYEKDRLDYLKAAERIEALVQRPAHEAVSALVSLRDSLHDGVRGLDMAPYRGEARGDIFAILQYYQFEAAVTCNAAIAAIELYRNDTGAIPQRLADLPPKFEAFIVPDPFSGEALRYARRNGPGYRVWSVGTNQRDGGGRVSGMWHGTYSRYHVDVGYEVKR